MKDKSCKRKRDETAEAENGVRAKPAEPRRRSISNPSTDGRATPFLGTSAGGRKSTGQENVAKVKEDDKATDKREEMGEFAEKQGALRQGGESANGGMAKNAESSSTLAVNRDGNRWRPKKPKTKPGGKKERFFSGLRYRGRVRRGFRAKKRWKMRGDLTNTPMRK